jgi:Trk K+ transport system NAD-binding subunit
MTTLVIGSGLIGSQIARILVERGEKPVLMDHGRSRRPSVRSSIRRR